MNSQSSQDRAAGNTPQDSSPEMDLCVERLVAEFWADRLGLDAIGPEENFFEKGGDSLMAMQLVSRLRRALGFEVSLNLVFDNPTIKQLASAIEKLRSPRA
ncbi:MAG: hypothetical protein LAO76_27810 [Acidobacteriia bacterium]|nr:hypothetical protein [Terriglobia bacterium]